jgi:hypothetical protein
MEELITALQSTATTAYTRTHILHYLSSKQDKLSANFEHKALRFDQKALSYEEEFPSLSSSSRPDHGPMNAVEASFLSSKRSYQSSPLELVGSSQAKRQTSVSVSAATVAAQVGISSSVFAKPRNPGQATIIPAKRFGEYHGSDKILQLATEIPPGAWTISSKKPTSSKSLASHDLSDSTVLPPPPSNHFDMFVAAQAAAASATAGSSSLPTNASKAQTGVPSATGALSSVLPVVQAPAAATATTSLPSLPTNASTANTGVLSTAVGLLPAPSGVQVPASSGDASLRDSDRLRAKRHSSAKRRCG